MRNEYLNIYPRFSIEVFGASEALHSMRKLGIKVGIVTNGQRDLQHAVIEALNFKQLVDAVIVSEEVDFQKPQKQIFEVVLQELHVEAKISHNG